MKKVSVHCLIFVAGVYASLAMAEQKHPSVNFYIHDVDAARQVIKKDRAAYETEVARLAPTSEQMMKFMSTPSPIVNASSALSRIHSAFQVKGPLSKCFGDARLSAITTASTDHACVEAAGFKR